MTEYDQIGIIREGDEYKIVGIDTMRTSGVELPDGGELSLDCDDSSLMMTAPDGGSFGVENDGETVRIRR